MTYEQFLAKEMGKKPTTEDVNTSNYVDFLGHRDAFLRTKAESILNLENKKQELFTRKQKQNLNIN